MRLILLLLQSFSARLDRRSRRLLLFAATLTLTLFARTTVAALHSGAYADAAAGLVMLGLAAVAAAVACSAPRQPG
ncbi:MAG TPA: hypothetical protein VFN46_08395 [Acetobacteraceae bacterium]|nr:hypothetical protein [Acetobacteraceae bacterium]